MLNDNIKRFRKQKGYSQETLAEQLHVVRQTISKWEKGISVPDAEMLGRMAELFEVPISDILSGPFSNSEEISEGNEVAKQLAILNDQLANQSARRRKIIRRSAIGIAIGIFIVIALYLFCLWAYRMHPTQNAVLTTTRLECELNGETYHYEVTYDEQYRIHKVGGDAWIADHVQTEQYNDANTLIAQVEDYFTDRGGTCDIIEEGAQ